MAAPIKKKNNDKKVVIIGGGPAGLTASYQLSKFNTDSVVLEKDLTVGGISKTVQYKKYYFDIGGHRFFTKIKAVDDMWQEVLGKDLLRRERLSRIYYNNKFFYYPLRVLNAFFGLGLWQSVLILISYLRVKLTPFKKDETLEQWVTNRFGRHLYNIFFKTYTEKVWGMPCDEIQAEWAAQRIKGLSLVTALKNALVKPQKSVVRKKKVIKTLIDEFHYPKHGPGMMWKAVAGKIQRNGSRLLVGNEVVGIQWSEDRLEAVKVKHNGNINIIEGTDFISSMPVREVIQKLDPAAPAEVLAAASELKYRDFLTVALIVDKEKLFADNWIYIHDPGVRVGRIQNFKNWSPHMVPDLQKTCLGLEYFCFEGDALWTMPDEELIELGKREIEALGFANQQDVKDGTVVRMPKAYPVYDSEYKAALTIIRKFLESFKNFQMIGRNGQHKYNNQDHSMLTGMMAAENILGARHDLWQINEEPEYHEEIVIRALKRVFARIDKFGFATASGAISGLSIFLATVVLILKGGDVVGPNIQLLNQYFIGYSVTFKGAFIGMGYGFLWAFLFGWLAAYLRNFLLAFYIYRLKKRKELLSFKDFMDHF